MGMITLIIMALMQIQIITKHLQQILIVYKEILLKVLQTINSGILKEHQFFQGNTAAGNSFANNAANSNQASQYGQLGVQGQTSNNAGSLYNLNGWNAPSNMPSSYANTYSPTSYYSPNYNPGNTGGLSYTNTAYGGNNMGALLNYQAGGQSLGASSANSNANNYGSNSLQNQVNVNSNFGNSANNYAFQNLAGAFTQNNAAASGFSNQNTAGNSFDHALGTAYNNLQNTVGTTTTTSQAGSQAQQNSNYNSGANNNNFGQFQNQYGYYS